MPVAGATVFMALAVLTVVLAVMLPRDVRTEPAPELDIMLGGALTSRITAFPPVRTVNEPDRDVDPTDVDPMEPGPTGSIATPARPGTDNDALLGDSGTRNFAEPPLNDDMLNERGSGADIRNEPWALMARGKALAPKDALLMRSTP